MGSNLIALFPISFLQFIVVSVLGEPAISLQLLAALILSRASILLTRLNVRVRVQRTVCRWLICSRRVWASKTSCICT